MAVNRFDTPIGQRHTSAYVPLPLNEISGLAKDYQDRFDLGMNKTKDLDVLSQAIKAAPVHYKLKDQVVGEYKKELEDLVANAKPEQYASREFQFKIDNLTNRFKNDPRVNTIVGTKAWWDKEYQPYLNNKENKKNLNITNLQDEKGNWKQVDHGVYSNDFIPYKENSKDLKTLMDDIKVDGVPLSGIRSDESGNFFKITNGKREYIDAAKVRSVADGNIENYANTEGGGFRFATILNRIGIDPHKTYTEFKYDENIPKEYKDAVAKELGNDLFNYGRKQIHTDTDVSYNIKNNAVEQRKNAIKDSALNSLGQTVLGSAEYDLTREVPSDIKSVIKTNSDGSVSINWDEFKPGTKVSGTMGSPMYASGFDNKVTKTGPDSKKTEALVKYVEQAANAIGWDKPLKANDYNTILTEYHKASKALSYDYVLPPVEQKIVKQTMLNDRRHWKYIDPDGKIITDPEELGAITNPKSQLSPDTRLYGNDGKTRISFTFKDPKNGELKQGVAESLVEENSTFHNVVSRLQSEALSYFKDGNVKSPEAKSFSKEMGFDNKNYTGPKPISVVPSPTGNKMYVILADPKNRHNQMYEELVLDDNKKIVGRKSISNLPQMMKLINADWYNTPEGLSEAYSIAPNKDQFESTLPDED